ncbi:MAG: phosphoribosylformylglycinamidine cyclo-ligase [Candidatus Magasanikbacteria bacterium]|nr:phosphoribosylformylglycinamidine cyclo-ligase [Candidatus Magasanikbacteria bacterium]
MTITYEFSGVNIDVGNEAVKRIKNKVTSTFSQSVLTGIGSFGAMYDLKNLCEKYNNPVLVQSIDGVGTKLMIAKMMNKYDTVGEDIVNHCCGDILTIGAKPLTFLDYIATAKMDPQIIEDIVSGMVRACKENDISLVGGETAEMPGVYVNGETDIAGSITGVVEKNKQIIGKNIEEGDCVLGFTSSGLHTNGYSLARKILFEVGGLSVHSNLSELDRSLGEVLLEPHKNYTKPVFLLLNFGINIKGIAHITGGGMLENIPRILPENCAVKIQKGSWQVLPIFTLMQKIGGVVEEEMYRTFNMGIGMVLILSKNEVENAINLINKSFPDYKICEIGKVVKREGQVIL